MPAAPAASLSGSPLPANRPIASVLAATLAILLTAVAPAPSEGQSTMRFQRLGADAGLSQMSVTSLAQDPLGFLWVGTQDGLNRYDGYGFTAYRGEPGGEGALGSSFVNDLLVDRDGILWVATFGGLSRYRQATDRFEGFRHRDDDPTSLPSNTVRSLLEDREGGIWVGTTQGPALLDRASGTFRSFAEGPSSEVRDVRALTQDPRGFIWLGTDGGLQILDPSSGETTPLVLQGDTLLADAHIWTLFTSSDGRVWVGTADQGLVEVDVESGLVHRYQALEESPIGLSHHQVRAISEDREGQIWVGTFDGLARLDRETGRFASWRHNPGDPLSLSQSSIWSILEDRQGLLWLGTQTGGLNLHNPRTTLFAHYHHRLDDPSGLPGNIVYEVRGAMDGSGELWVGTRDAGLARLHPEEGTLVTFAHDPQEPSSLPENYIVAVDQAPDGTLWIGTYESGLAALDPSTGRATRYRHDPGDPSSLSGDRIRDVLVDPDGSIWVGTSGTGLNRLDPGTGHFTLFHSSPEDPTTVSSGFIRSLYLDRDGELWVGTYGNGANRFHRETGTFTRYLHEADDPTTLGSPFVRSIFQHSSGQMWFATDGGVSRMDPVSETFQRYGVGDGLASLVVYGILEDDHGRLWMSTNGGISRYDPQEETFLTFSAQDGLQGNEFNTGAFWKEPDGRLYFGGVNGLTAFHPDSVSLEEPPPPVVLTDFLLFNRSVPVADTTPLKVHPSVVEEIRLAPGVNVLTFEFTALGFRRPGRTEYEYRLAGFEDRWIPTSSDNRRATFTSLPPGAYTFQVRAAHSRGDWGEPASVRLTILPAFWQTTGFRILAGLLVTGLVGGTAYWRYRDLRRRNDLLEDMVQERTGELERNLSELRRSNLLIKRLEGLLPICSACKKVRVEDGEEGTEPEWVSVESFVSERSDADFSHSICPSCSQDLYPELVD